MNDSLMFFAVLVSKSLIFVLTIGVLVGILEKLDTNTLLVLAFQVSSRIRELKPLGCDKKKKKKKEKKKKEKKNSLGVKWTHDHNKRFFIKKNILKSDNEYRSFS